MKAATTPHPCASPEEWTEYLEALLRSAFGSKSVVALIQTRGKWLVGSVRTESCVVRDLIRRGWVVPRNGVLCDVLRLTRSGREVCDE